MQISTYYAPTKVVFGKDAENEVGSLIKKEGCKKVLLHYGSESAKKSGLLGKVQHALKQAEVEVVELGGVVANPHVSLVREGVQLCKKEKIDFILAVGGGSVIDSAKAIGYGSFAEEDVWQLYTKEAQIQGCLPIGVVLTISAAGSEMSESSVITNEEVKEKKGVSHEASRPKFAIMNPELTLTLPAYQTAVGCVDVLMHTVERYFTGNDAHMQITDGIAEALMRTTIENARILTRDPKNYEARAEIMWAGSLSHNGLTAFGGGFGDWACHQMGHELSAKYDLAHGASLAVLFASWARYVYKENPKRFARFAINVMEVPHEGSVEEVALAGIEEVEEFFWALEVPTTLEEAGIKITDEDAHDLAVRCSYFGKRTVGSMKKLEVEDTEKIYKTAR